VLTVVKKVMSSCKDVRWVELAQDFVSSWAFVLSVLKFRLCQSISDMGLRQIDCDHGKWIELA
jgi:hypothetical protein